MQFIEGGSLGQLLNRRRRLPLGEATTIIEQCLSGLKAAHAQGLVHRDVKPGNVLLNRGAPGRLPQGEKGAGHGEAVLVDFGLVRQIGAATQLTSTGVVMGTVDYIAPEQARGQKVDGRSDIYSLGVMYYQMLSGRLPFKAETPTAMIFQHAYEAPFPLAQAAPDLPKPLIEIIARMMAKEPAQRYESCAAVLSDLRALKEGRPLKRAADSEIFALASGPNGPPATDRPAARPPAAADRARENANTAPSLLLPSNSPWQRAKDWAATMFRRHAPDALQELQGTTQQVDAAVAGHERRFKRLKGLRDEARRVVAELAVQIAATEKAARDLEAQAAKADDPHPPVGTRRVPAEAIQDKLRACREDLAALHTQHDEQQVQAGRLEMELAKAKATVLGLRSQRDVLKARMKAVEAQQRVEGTAPLRRIWFGWERKRLLAVAGSAALVFGTLFMLLPGKKPALTLPVPHDPASSPGEFSTHQNPLLPPIVFGQWMPLFTSPDQLVGWTELGGWTGLIDRVRYSGGILETRGGAFIDYPIITKEVSIRARTKIVLADKMHIELFLRSSDKGRYGANFDGRRFGIGRYDYGKGWVSLAKGDSPGPFGDYFDFEFSAIGGGAHADRQRQNVAAESRFELYGGHRRSWRKWEWFVLRCRDSHSDQGSVGCRQAPAIGHYEECPAGRFQQRKVAAERSGQRRRRHPVRQNPLLPPIVFGQWMPLLPSANRVLVWDRLNNRVRYSNRDLEPTSKKRDSDTGVAGPIGRMGRPMGARNRQLFQ